MYYADYLEKIAYNVLPTQHDDNFTRKQYYQQTNQILITDDYRHFDCDYKSSTVFGTTTGYPCCVCNMHQGWPKFVQNLWYATADNGLAALVYAQSSVKAKVAEGVEVEFKEETNYPFGETVKFTYVSAKNVRFPFHLRIPGWCKNPEMKVNGQKVEMTSNQNVTILNRTWNNGDVVELRFPMEIRFSNWFEHSLGIERGPLVFAIKVDEEWKEVKSNKFEDTFFEVYPTSPWNYGIPNKYVNQESFKVDISEKVSTMPWILKNAPIKITNIGKRIPFWQMYEGSTGKIPYSPHPLRKLDTPEENITLLPYGCTTLRIAEIPVVEKQVK
jgi:hypothetical protein